MLVRDLKKILDQMDPTESISGAVYDSDEDFVNLLNGRSVCIIPRSSEYMSEAVLVTNSTIIALPKNPRRIIGIWAQDNNGLIGSNNKLPWKNPDDMEFFKQMITDKVIVMGRVTSECVKDLPSKERIVFSNMTVEDVLSSTDEDLFICGGSKTYDAFAQYYTHLYITTIDGEYEGDSYIPDTIDLSDYDLEDERVIAGGVIREYVRKPMTYVN